MTTITEKAKSMVDTKTVFVRANNSRVVPLEWPLDEDGNPNVSTCEYTTQGKMINVKQAPTLVFDKNCYMKLDMTKKKDQLLYEVLKDWLENSGDPRIESCGIEVSESENVEPVPFPRYDSMNIKTILEIIESMLDDMGDAPAERAELLESIARYELQRVYPVGHEKAGQKNVRQGVLKGLDKLGTEVGVEDGTAEVEE